MDINQGTKYTFEASPSLCSDQHKTIVPEGDAKKSNRVFLFIAIVVGLLSFIGGVLSISFDLFELIMRDRIKMRPDSLPAKMWANPPVWVLVEIHIFSVTNSDEFLAGNDTKLNLKDIPIYYRNYAQPVDIVYENNSTLSFTTTHNLKFAEDINEPGILNKSVIIPNNMLLGMASYLYDSSGIVKFTFNIIAKKNEIFLNRTIYQILWNLTTPILEDAKKIPFLRTRQNAGFLYNTFYPSEIRYNVQIGTEHGFENFFKINTLNGNSWLPAHHGNVPSYCPFFLNGTNDIASFPQFLSKTTSLTIQYHNLCRTFSLQYNREVKFESVDAYEYILKDDTFKRLNDSSIDCLKETNGLILPDGLSDASKCSLNMPVAISPPHFYGFNGEWNNYLDGLEGNNKKHLSVVIAEPKTGGVLLAKISLQTNLLIANLSSRYFSRDMRKFNNMILPLYWLEYKIEMDQPIANIINILSKYIPIMQLTVSVMLFSLCFMCLLKVITIKRLRVFFFGNSRQR